MRLSTLPTRLPRAALAAALTALTALTALLGLALGLAAPAAHAAPEPLPLGSAPPDFTLHSLDGRNLRLSELRGQVVLLNFWATWCGPCREEMPQLERLHQKYKASGFTLIGVNIDEDPKAAAAVAARLKLSFPVLLDTDRAVAKRFALSTMPSTVVIDRDGKLRQVHLGYHEGTIDTYEQQVRNLLKE